MDHLDRYRLTGKIRQTIDREATRVPNTPYYVIMWDDKTKVQTFTYLKDAKKRARAHGYTYSALWKGNMPNAYVAIDCYNIDGKIVRCCLYNPRFK